MIVLVQPSSRERGKLIFPPLGLMHVAALPDARGLDVRILDGNLLSPAALRQTLADWQPQVVGITSFTGPMLEDALSIARFVRERTSAIIVWGGVHASMEPAQTAANDCVDYVVVGEGDETFMDLLDHLDTPEQVPGLVFERDGELIRTPARPQIADLGRLPLLPWHLVDGPRYLLPWARARRTLPLATSRGCIFSCRFCYNQVFNGGTWRPFPMERLHQEIAVLADRFGVDGVRLDASDLFIGPGVDGREHAMDVARELGRRGLSWSCQTVAAQTRPDLLQTFRENGCTYIFYGLESGSLRIRRKLGKGLRLERVREVVGATHDLGMTCATGFMYDYPTETLDEARETFDLIDELGALVRFTAIQPYPGTPVFEESLSSGRLRRPETTADWAAFDFDHPHGLSEIPDVQRRGRRWNLRFNYAHNVKVAVQRREREFLRAMSRSFVEYYALQVRNSWEMGY